VGVPLIVSQPTVPIDSPLVNRRVTPMERRDNRRRVADRSVAMRRGGGSSLGWLWLVLAIAGGVGGAFYYYSKRGFAPFAAAVSDSAAAASSGVASDSLLSAPAAPRDTARPTASPPAPAPADSTPASKPAPEPARPAAPARTPPPPASPPPAAAAPADSGAVRLVGLPRGSTVMIDEKPVQDAVTPLTAGAHMLAISAPRFNFFTDTIRITGGDTLELTPALLPLGAAARPDRDPSASPPVVTRMANRCSPGPGYNSDGSCFDDRPKPVSPPFVPRPEGLTGTPRPSLLWVKVSAEGRTVDIKRLRQSNDAAFEMAARDFVWTVAWHPATKDGVPVEAWTQMLFPPMPE
jgi:hypothetical protein